MISLWGGKACLERNIIPSDSFSGVIMEKLKQNKTENLLYFQQVNQSFMLYLSLSFVCLYKITKRNKVDGVFK